MDKVTQLSVVIPDTGSVSAITDVLGSADVDILGFSVCETGGRGVLRLVVDRTEEAVGVLAAAGYAIREDEVVCLGLPHQPGGLAGVLRTVADAGVKVEYVYSLIGPYVVLSVADIGRAAGLLKGRPVQMVSHSGIVKG